MLLYSLAMCEHVQDTCTRRSRTRYVYGALPAAAVFWGGIQEYRTSAAATGLLAIVQYPPVLPIRRGLVTVAALCRH